MKNKNIFTNSEPPRRQVLLDPSPHLLIHNTTSHSKIYLIVCTEDLPLFSDEALRRVINGERWERARKSESGQLFFGYVVQSEFQVTLLLMAEVRHPIFCSPLFSDPNSSGQDSPLGGLKMTICFISIHLSGFVYGTCRLNMKSLMYSIYQHAVHQRRRTLSGCTRQDLPTTSILQLSYPKCFSSYVFIHRSTEV